jgi:hypothetical protein
MFKHGSRGALSRALVITALAGAPFIASPVRAASQSCNIDLALPDCRTSPVPANGQWHFVHIDVSSFLTYSVVDAGNGVRVAHGTTGVFGTSRTITGLYSRYYLHLMNGVTGAIIGGSGTINNN